MRLFAAMVLLGCVMAAPASAQIWSGPTPQSIGKPYSGIRGSLPASLAKADREIGEGRSAGQLTRGEARQLRRESRAIVELAASFAVDGLSASEERELETRAALLHDDIVRARSFKTGAK